VPREDVKSQRSSREYVARFLLARQERLRAGLQSVQCLPAVETWFSLSQVNDSRGFTEYAIFWRRNRSMLGDSARRLLLQR
jgi:hypothetical protein